MMSLTYSHFENPGHRFPLQSMSHNYNGGRYGLDRSNRQYRLPPPHSSIPIGLIVDDQHMSSHQRTDVPHSRSDLPSPRESLPSVHQLLSDTNTSYLPSITTQCHGRSLQSSPSIRSRPPSSHYNPPRSSDGAFSDYASLSPSSDREYEHYRSPQSTRLLPISQVGLEASHTCPPHRACLHLVSDDESPGVSPFRGIPRQVRDTPTRRYLTLYQARGKRAHRLVHEEGPLLLTRSSMSGIYPGKGSAISLQTIHTARN